MKQTPRSKILKSILRFFQIAGLSLLFAACTNPLAKSPVSDQSSPGKIFLAVNSIVPSGGPLAGGTRIRVLGQGYNIDSKIKIGSLDCLSLSYVSIDELTCTVPGPHGSTESLDVTVTNPSGATAKLANGFTYRPAPTVLGVSPNFGRTAGGNAVTLSGTGFVSGIHVSMGGASCGTVNVVSTTSLTCVTNSRAAGTVDVIVANSDSQGATLTNSFEYRIEPVIQAISPTGGDLPGGTVVTITGSNFLSGIAVSVGGVSCASLTLASPTSMTCTTGAHAAGTVNVVATNSNGMSGTLANGFTYRPKPTITNVAPSIGPLAGGTVLTLTGTGYEPGIAITVDGAVCGSVNIASDTSLTCLSPGPHAEGVVNVSATTVDGQTNTLANSFTYMDPPLAPSSLVASPTSETAVSLTWTDNSNNEANFRIERSLDGTTFVEIATVGANSTSFSNTALTTDQKYFYRVRAYNLAAYSAYTIVDDATPIGVHIEVPIEMMDTGVAADTLAVKWERSRTTLNTTDYDGTVTYRLEAICGNTNASTTLVLGLINSSEGSMASLSVPPNAGVPTRYETTWTPTTGSDNYRLQTPAVLTGTLTCYSARILVQQVNATKTKIYIPLTAGAYNQVDSDNTATGLNVAETSGTTYTQPIPGQFSLWTKDTSRFADIATGTPWTLETIISSDSGGGRVSLYNKTLETMVTGTEITTTSSVPTLTTISFADTATNFTNLDSFEVRIRKNGGSGAIFKLYKAGLWVRLTNLNKADVYYRNSRFISTSASLVSGHSRVRIDLDRFLNIVPVAVYHEVIGSEPVVGSSDIILRSTGTSVSATAGNDLSSAAINFDVTGKKILRSGALTIVSGDNFISSHTVTSGTLQTSSSFIILSFTK